jgi:hypothetical protein
MATFPGSRVGAGTSRPTSSSRPEDALPARQVAVHRCGQLGGAEASDDAGGVRLDELHVEQDDRSGCHEIEDPTDVRHAARPARERDDEHLDVNPLDGDDAMERIGGAPHYIGVRPRRPPASRLSREGGEPRGRSDP